LGKVRLRGVIDAKESEVRVLPPASAPMSGASSKQAWPGGEAFRPLKASHRLDAGAAITSLADDLETTGAPARALDRFRLSIGAASALLWSVEGTHAIPALYAGAHPRTRPSKREALDLGPAIERLHRGATITCRSGETSGIEQLAPAGMKSFVVARGAGRGPITSILVLGWSGAIPPCDEGAIDQLRVATTLIERSLNDVLEQRERTMPSRAQAPSLDDASLAKHEDIPAEGSETHGSPDRASDSAWPLADKRFHEIADALPLPIWMVAADGTFIDGNSRWLNAATGNGRHSSHPMRWTDAFYPDDRRRAKAALRTAVERQERFELELRLRASDGTLQWVACIGAPHRMADGSIDRYVGFCADVSAKRRAESAVNQIAAKLVAAQEAERSRIARELHDDLGQQIALLASKMDALKRSYTRSHGRGHAILLEACQDLQEMATTVHNLSHELHPAKLKLLGLVQTLRALCRDLTAEGNAQIRFDAPTVPPDIDDATALCLFRVAQEALQNCVKHSGARAIDVQMTGDADCLVLQIRDDGAGFDPLVHRSAGLGLLTMRERVELVGGTLLVDTMLEHGTTIEVRLPMKRDVANEIS
jgi:PAS domain S-box-containing protein